MTKKVVKVVVLGDIGRSPRMQYHALSLARNGLFVNIIGYLETEPISEISENPNIMITKINPISLQQCPKLMQYALKALWQMISLFLTLFITGNCNYVLCQNPPAVPTLLVCRFYCLVTRTRFIIDWHNYAYTIMALSLSKDHVFVKIAYFIEMFFGQSSHTNFCVTYAMKEDLLHKWNIEATVLYDRPPKIFHPITIEEKHNWFTKIAQKYSEFRSNEEKPKELHSIQTDTALTQMFNAKIVPRVDRPGLIFSSTSWTSDEDFGILFDALQVYETTYNLTHKLPKLICVVTGKGPMKKIYLKQLEAKRWQHVKVITPWLDACDYPKMVASADLGVCLHTSSSGLDLPMKVVDMFGAGLPVCAMNFNCLNELVQHSINGYIFDNSDQLARHIVEWFDSFPNNEKQNLISARMRKELEKFQNIRWEENWDLRVKKYFL